MNETGRGHLDFQHKAYVLQCQISGSYQPLQGPTFRSGRRKSSLRHVAQDIFKKVGLEGLRDMVEDTGDILDYFCNDGLGRPYLSTDRRNTWCKERCLSGERRTAHKGLFTPDPWPYEESEYRTVGPVLRWTVL